MKHKLNFQTIVLLLSATIITTSCSNNDSKNSDDKENKFTMTSKLSGEKINEKEAEDYVAKFFKTYNNQEFETISDYFLGDMKTTMKEMIPVMYKRFGELQTSSKYKTKSLEKENEIALFYKCDFKNKDKNIFIKFEVNEEYKKFKISSFNTSDNKNKLENTTPEKALNTGKIFYEYVQNNKYDDLFNLLDDKAFSDKLKRKFIDVVKMRKKAFGKITEYKYNSFSTANADNRDVYIMIYECKTESKKPLFEKVAFIDRSGTYKIVNYKYSRNLEKIK
jgi:hypothetical protein